MEQEEEEYRGQGASRRKLYNSMIDDTLSTLHQPRGGVGRPGHSVRAVDDAQHGALPGEQ